MTTNHEDVFDNEDFGYTADDHNVCDPMSRNFDGANPEPYERNRGKRQWWTRVDGDNQRFRFKGVAAHFWESKDERNYHNHRASIFVTSGKQVVVHYTRQCTAYRDYSYNKVLTLDLNQLHEAAKAPKSFWQRVRKYGWWTTLNMVDVEGQITHHILNHIPSYAHAHIQQVLESFVYEHEEHVIHIE